MKREIEYTRKNGRKQTVECGFIMYNLIRFIEWLEKVVEENAD